MAKDTYKAGFVAIVGRPNVGKSTLLNAFLDFNLSIITPKPQTTRHRILGIHNRNHFQMIFWDTPGLLDPEYKLHEVMMQSAHRAVADSDVILLLIDATRSFTKKNADVLKYLATLEKPLIVAINKIDAIDKKEVLPLIDSLQKMISFSESVPISALNGENLDTLERVLVKYLPVSPPLYPPEQLTAHPERFFVSEIIREKVFRELREEIPYSTAVVIDEFRERPGRKDYIKARIVVERDSQKKIVIGKRAGILKTIGKLAREDIESFLGRAVYLDLWVVVRENWRKKETFLKEYGYDT